jgi:protein-disulfide isomerase
MAKTDSENKFSLASFINFINDNFTLIIIFLIVVVLGFLGGSLWTENQLLKSDGANTAKEQAVDLENTESIDGSLNLDKIPSITSSDHVLGAKNADIVMISYSDFQCPYCQNWHPTFNSLVEKYADQITFAYRHFSLGFSYSDKLAQASECVAEYGDEEAFWKFTDTLYEKLQDQSVYTTEGESSVITDDSILTIAANSGASLSQVKTCLETQEKADVITKMMSGAKAAGIGGTPSTIIISKEAGRELVPGAISLEEVEAMLEKHL